MDNRTLRSPTPDTPRSMYLSVLSSVQAAPGPAPRRIGHGACCCVVRQSIIIKGFRVLFLRIRFVFDTSHRNEMGNRHEARIEASRPRPAGATRTRIAEPHHTSHREFSGALGLHRETNTPPLARSPPAPPPRPTARSVSKMPPSHARLRRTPKSRRSRRPGRRGSPAARRVQHSARWTRGIVPG